MASEGCNAGWYAVGMLFEKAWNMEPMAMQAPAKGKISPMILKAGMPILSISSDHFLFSQSK